MAYHPRDPMYRNGLSRRDFLRRSLATGLTLPSAAAILAACGDTGPGAGGGGDGGEDLVPRIGTVDSPVSLQIYDDNQAIASDLPQEEGPLVIYNWEQYTWKALLKDFGEEYGVDWKYETFYNMEEAIQKIQTGDITFDVFFPTIDQLPKLVAAKLIQPLNHDYLPNISNLWPAMQDPYYDQGSQYSVPYTIYATGIGWRTDQVPLEVADLQAMDDPWEVFWDPAYAGITGIYDEYREAMNLAMLRNEGPDVDLNTSDPAIIDRARQALLELNSTMDIRVSIEGAYVGIPEGRYGLHQAWSGDIQATPWYAGDPKIEAPLFRWYWPARDGKGGVIDNDLYTIPRGAKNPVLAHKFLNFMLDEFNGIKNWSWVGYQVPFNAVDPTTVFQEGYPGLGGYFAWEYKGHWDNLESTILTQDDFTLGQRNYGLPIELDLQYQDAFNEFRSGATVEES